MLAIIAAVSDNGVIGKDQTIPWDCPEDMRRFVAVTKRHPIIMGRKTYESIGKALPGRLNIVVTSQHIDAVDVHSVNSLDNALKFAEFYSQLLPFVIGGTRLYKEALKYATRLYITKIHQTIKDGDALFPAVDWRNWSCIDEEPHTGFTFTIFERRGLWDTIQSL